MIFLQHILRSVRVILCDAKDGFVEISRNGLALVGLVVVTITMILSARPELQDDVKARLLGWLESRQLSSVWSTASGYAALQRTTAGDPLNLPADQASVTYWLSRKYNISPEPMSVLVAEAFQLGERAQIAPTLILAIVAIESNFNPYAQSALGGQGLMHILPDKQSDKLESFGGPMATFDPLSNLRVGVKVLHDLVVQNGSIDAGLAAYAEATKSRESNYLDRVWQEEQRLSRITQSVRQARQQDANLRPMRGALPAKSDAISL
jgi:hypothetical protein